VNKVLEIARQELGYKPGKDKKSKYGVWYGFPGFETAPWCGMFVSWCFDKAGLTLPPIQSAKGFAYCPFAVRWFKDNQQFHKHPRIGDIVFFDWGKDGTADHVGLVEEVYPTYIKTIEGNTSIANQSNGGMVMRRTRYYPSIVGFARLEENQDSDRWSGFYLELTNPLTRRAEVGKLQTGLKKLGYDLAIDNVYGESTITAVKHFQQKNNLEADGVVGALTWTKIMDKIKQKT
jgi:Putative peptidoglycan binding domain/CHAP domain